MTSTASAKYILSGLILLVGMSCSNSNSHQNTLVKILPSDKERTPQLALPYERDYMTMDSARLSIKVYALPALFDLESMQDRAAVIPADGRFADYGVDKIFQINESNLDLKFCEANEVGFVRRYQHFIEAKVGTGYSLDCGLTIGDPARLLVETESAETELNKKSIRYDKLSEIEFYDHWGIYTHTYRIQDGLIVGLEISF